jgi:hypothetical protein
VVEDIQAGVVAGTFAKTATLALGKDTHVTLASPIATEGALATHLAARGEGPFSVALRANRHQGELDHTLSHGARLSIIGPDR